MLEPRLAFEVVHGGRTYQIYRVELDAWMREEDPNCPELVWYVRSGDLYVNQWPGTVKDSQAEVEAELRKRIDAA